MKVLGGVTFGITSAVSIGLAYNYYDNGGTDWRVGVKSALDVTFGAVAFFGPVGLGISSAYFILDYATDGFGGWGDPLKTKK